MSEPLIPYITLPEVTLLNEHTFDILGRAIDVGPWSIKPFGALVATGVYLGILLATYYARKREIIPEVMSRFLFWGLVFAFVTSHVLDTVFYHPAKVLSDPLSLVRIWDGLSSFGGFLGGVLGALAFKYRFGVRRVLPMADTMAAAFPVGWTLGRTGCAVVHDHPGMRSDLWFAVQYPGGGRFDLGLYEMVFALSVAITCLILARKARPVGFYLGFTMLVYAPVRFALDFLRARPTALSGGDPRYLMLTPAQWASFLMVSAGFYLLYRAADSGEVGNEPFRESMQGLDESRLTRRRLVEKS